MKRTHDQKRRCKCGKKKAYRCERAELEALREVVDLFLRGLPSTAHYQAHLYSICICAGITLSDKEKQ